MSSMIEDKYIGLGLAITSTLAIGSSFVITKKGLLDAAEKHGFEGDGYVYLLNPIWWSGIITLAVGEIANFAAYAFAPAILVTPLGALSVLIGAVLGSYFLDERLGRLGKLGCAICLIGSLIIVLHAPPDKDIKTIDEILHYAMNPGFLIYCFLVIVFASVMIYRVAPTHGRRDPLIFISICSTVGSISVMSVKAFGIALKLTLSGSNQFSHPSTYVFVIVSLICILTQMNYFNKALSQFSTNIVNPLYYVTFTSCTLTASFLLFGGFGTTSGRNTISLLCGFITIFLGVYLLNLSQADPDGHNMLKGKHAINGGIPTDPIAGFQTRMSLHSRRNSLADPAGLGLINGGAGSRQGSHSAQHRRSVSGANVGLMHGYDEEHGGYGLQELTEEPSEDDDDDMNEHLPLANGKIRKKEGNGRALSPLSPMSPRPSR